MASIIGIKNIKWCDIKAHHINNIARSANDGYVAVTKNNVYAAARIRHTAVLIHSTLKIIDEKLNTITEAWSATVFKSNILGIKTDRQTINLIRKTRKDWIGNPGFNFKEYTSRDFVELRNKVDAKANHL